MQNGGSWLINMVLILGVTFGGFAWCIWKTMQSQEGRTREQKKE